MGQRVTWCGEMGCGGRRYCAACRVAYMRKYRAWKRGGHYVMTRPVTLEDRQAAVRAILVNRAATSAPVVESGVRELREEPVDGA